MHQMRISTIKVDSVMLRPKKLVIRKFVKTIEEPGEKPECHEIEPNPLKVRAVHKGDNPSFQDEFI
jgi:hypothetical protein